MKLRKSGTSLIMTIPKDIADLFGIIEGKELEIEAMGSDSLGSRWIMTTKQRSSRAEEWRPVDSAVRSSI